MVERGSAPHLRGAHAFRAPCLSRWPGPLAACPYSPLFGRARSVLSNVSGAR
jgi:hypothetical protein